MSHSGLGPGPEGYTYPYYPSMEESSEPELSPSPFDTNPSVGQYSSIISPARKPRPAPPIYLPPPPPLSSDSESETGSRTSSVSVHSFEQYHEGLELEQGQGQSQGTPTIGGNAQSQFASIHPSRWGRSNWTRDEIETLEIPLSPDRRSYGLSQDYAVSDIGQGQGQRKRPVLSSKCFRILDLILITLPALCFTGAAHFVNDIMTDFKLFSASFSVFQGLFWPSLVFLVIDLVLGRGGGGFGVCGFGRMGGCSLVLWLIGHSVLSSISLIALLLSIQRLNISVALALSFASTIFVILLASINRSKKFSLEMITFSMLGYSGFIIVGLPAILSKRGSLAEDLTAGIVASLIASACAVPATFILASLRREKVPDSLLGVTFSLTGSILSLLVKVLMETEVIFNIEFDPLSVGWAAGLILLVIFGTILTYIEGKFRAHFETEREQPSILRLRLLIFVFSCFWEIVRQGIWHNFPDVYDILGSITVFTAFLLSVGYEAWTLRVDESAQEKASPFQFLSWLFASGRSNNHVMKQKKSANTS